MNYPVFALHLTNEFSKINASSVILTMSEIS